MRWGNETPIDKVMNVFDSAIDYIASIDPEKAQELRAQHEAEERAKAESEKSTKEHEREQFLNDATEKYLNRNKKNPLGGKSI